jgi:hypothetical protein
MRVTHLCVAIALALGGCGGSDLAGGNGDPSQDGGVLFGNCHEMITPAPTGMPLHVLPGGLISTCGEQPFPFIGLTRQARGFVIATVPNLVIHVQGDDGFSKDIDTTKALDPSGYTLATMGPIHVSVDVRQALIEYQQGPGDWRYTITDGPAPVTFASP